MRTVRHTDEIVGCNSRPLWQTAATTFPVKYGRAVIVLVKLLAAEAGAYCFAGQVLRNDDVCAAAVIELGSGDPACNMTPDS